MSTKRTVGFKAAFVASAVCVILPGQLGFAADIVKTTVSGPWTNTTSVWTGNVPPGAGDVAVFTNTTTADVTLNLNGDRSVSGLRYNYTGTGNYLLAGGSDANSVLTIGTNGIVVTGGSGRAPRISTHVTLGADQTWSVSGISQMVVAAGKTLSNDHTLTVDGGATVAITGTITGSGKIVKNSTGSSVLSLYQASDFSGGVELNSGVLRLDNNTALGTGMLTISGGSIGAVNTNAINAANAVSVTGDFGYSTGGGNATLTLSGDMALNGAVRTITQGNTSSTLYLNGAISNGGLIKEGAGLLSLGGVNTYTDDTTVSAGTLLLADNSQMQFVIGVSGVNNKIDGAGILTADGDFAFDLTGAGTTVGDTWTIANVSSQTFGATFSVVGFTADGDLWNKAINGTDYYQFDEGTGVLTVIPEPATIGMLGLGAMIAALIRRMSTR